MKLQASRPISPKTLHSQTSSQTKNRLAISRLGILHGRLIRTLRKTYGPGFAAGCKDDEKLSDVLHKLDETSLSQLIRDHEAGHLEQICRAA